MFCRKCGRLLDDGSTICPDCDIASVEAVEFSPVGADVVSGVNAPVNKGSRKAGLGLGIAAAVLALVGFFFTYFAVMYMAGLAMELDSYAYSSYYVIEEAELMAACMLGLAVGVLGLICVIPALILGIISLIRAIKQKKRGQVLPIPALALGIAACVFAALAVLMFLLSGLMTVALMDTFL